MPGDKSIAHRALMLGALTREGLRIRRIPDSEDVRATLRCLRDLGVAVKKEAAGDWVVSGRGGSRPFAAASRALDCGGSATTMRLLAGLLAGHPFETALIGDGSLSRRPMTRLAEPLAAMGAEIRLSAGGVSPMEIRGRAPLRALTYRLPVPSAQVKSALLMAGLFSEGIVRISDPFGTRDHTERLLSWLSEGKAVRREGNAVCVGAAPLLGGATLTIPGDFSSAAFHLGAAALLEGSEVVVAGVGLNPSRTGFLDALRSMGARVELSDLTEEAGEMRGSVKVSYAPLSSIRLRAEQIPSLIDEVPILAVVAARARGESCFEGLGELRLKESNRLEGIARGLRAMGAEIELRGDTLLIRGPVCLQGASLQSLGDHRLAMALSVAALAAEGESVLDHDACVAASYPDFFSDLETLLRRIEA